MHPIVSEQIARSIIEDRLRAASRARRAQAVRQAPHRGGVRRWAGTRLIGLGRRLAGPAGAAT